MGDKARDKRYWQTIRRFLSKKQSTGPPQQDWMRLYGDIDEDFINEEARIAGEIRNCGDLNALLPLLRAYNEHVNTLVAGNNDLSPCG